LTQKDKLIYLKSCTFVNVIDKKETFEMMKLGKMKNNMIRSI